MKFIESRSLSISVFLHIAAVIIATIGLPVLLPEKPDPQPLVMTVELLPMSEISNVKPSDKQIQKEQKAPVVKNTKPIPPTIKEPPKPKDPPPPEPEKKPFNPMDDAEPLPADKQKPKEQEKPKEEPKPQKEPEKPKDQPKQKPQEDFQALLNKLQAEAKANQVKDAKDKTNQEENKTRSDAPYDDSMPMSISEKDMIRSQFIPCWTMPAGAKDAHTLAARVKLKLQADGTVLEATLAPDQRGRYNSDPFFRAAADSAIRAAHKCSPLKNLPADKYNSWKDMELNFNPADL